MTAVLVTTPATLLTVLGLSYAARWMRRRRPAGQARPVIHAEITEVPAYDRSYQVERSDTEE